MKKILLSAALIAVSFTSFAQVGVGTTSPDASAELDVTSTTKGFLMPRMATAARTAISTPATGLQVYDTDTNSIWYYNGTTWVEASGTGSKWTNDSANSLVKLTNLSDGLTTRTSSKDVIITDNNSLIVGGIGAGTIHPGRIQITDETSNQPRFTALNTDTNKTAQFGFNNDGNVVMGGFSPSNGVRFISGTVGQAGYISNNGVFYIGPNYTENPSESSALVLEKKVAGNVRLAIKSKTGSGGSNWNIIASDETSSFNDGDLTFREASGSVNALTIAKNGNVLIGNSDTTTTDQRLKVSGPLANSPAITVNETTNNGTMRFGWDNSNVGRIGTSDGQGVQFLSGNGVTFTAHSDHSVQFISNIKIGENEYIGFGASGTRIVGSSTNNNITFLNNGGGEVMRISSSNNVGIGTTTPGSKLSVVGLVEYADNAAATTAGLTAGDFYRTADGTVKVVY